MDLPLETPEVVETVGPDPLTIHLIAESVFSHLSIYQLKSCRELSWSWRQTLTTLFNSRSQELYKRTFSGSESEIENPENPDAAPSLVSMLPNYMKYLKEESDLGVKLLFSHFRFYNLPLEQPLLQQFLNQFGHTIRKLDLSLDGEADYRKFDNSAWSHYGHSRSGGSVESFWKLLSTQCPELQELKLEQMSFQTTNEDAFPPFRSKIKRLTFTRSENLRQLQSMIKELFRNCHLLERLILDHDNCSEVLASALCESPHLSALKELTLEDSQLIQLWSENPARCENILRNLRLKKLKIYPLTIRHLDGLNWFLQSQKSSLETLNITWYQFNLWFQHGGMQPEPLRQLPSSDVMEKLRELRIRMHFDKLPCPFQPIDFRRQFPSLNTLILQGDAINLPMDSWFVAGSQPQLILKALQLPCGISPEHLRRAGEIFPNVKLYRNGKLGELAVRQLFSQWPQLESLYLDEFEGNDSMLTGLSPGQLEAAEKIRLKIGSEIRRIISLISPAKMAPSITNFKDLKELVVHNSQSGQLLTDLSLRYAISNLENLEYLRVAGYKFSEEGIKDFRNSIPHLQVYKNEHTFWKDAFHYQKDLARSYYAVPIIDEEFASYHYPF